MQRFLAWTDALLLRIAIAFFGGFLVGVCLQVLFRYVLQRPLPWSEELSVYLFVWSSFITAAILVGKNEHFSIPFLATRLPARPRWLIEVVGIILCMLFVLIMIWRGTLWSWRMAPALSTVLQVSQGAVYTIIPFSGLYMLLHLSVRLADLLRRPSDCGGGSPC